MKKILLLLCLGVLLISACKENTNKGDNAAQLGAIPSDAFFVVGFESKQIIQKGSLDKLQDFKSYKPLKQEMEAVRELNRMNSFEQFTKDPKSLGLKNDHVYIYGVKQNDKSNYWAVVLKMEDMKTCESNISKLLGTSDSTFKNKGDYKLFVKENEYSDNVYYVWNKNLLFIIVGKVVDTNFEELFARAQDKSILANEDFIEFQKRPYDMGVWMPISSLADFYQENMENDMKLSFWEEMRGAYAHFYTKFEDGEINTTIAMSPKAKVQEMIDKYKVLKKDFDHELLNNFPAKSFLLIKASINVKEYLALLTSTAKELASKSNYQYTTEGVEKRLNSPEAQVIANALGGDMVVSLYDFAKGPLPIPLMSLSFNVKSEQDFNKMIELLPAKTLSKNSAGYYTVSAFSGLNAYLAYKDKRVYVSNDIDAINSFLSKGFADNLSKSELGSSMKTDMGVFYLNLNIDAYPQGMKMMLQQQGGYYYSTLLPYLKIYESFTYKLKQDNEVEMTLKLKNKSKNALKQILNNADENIEVMFQ